MEIEVEEYVRTKKGLIGKVNKIESAGSGVRFAGEFLTDTIIQFNDGKSYERRVIDKDIANHSFNIIDLIEVGDIVVMLDTKFNTKDYIFINDIEMLQAVRTDLKDRCKLETILTKEIYQASCYTVERKEE